MSIGPRSTPVRLLRGGGIAAQCGIRRRDKLIMPRKHRCCQWNSLAALTVEAEVTAIGGEKVLQIALIDLDYETQSTNRSKMVLRC